MPSAWLTSGCSDQAFRILDNGAVEIDGQGIPTKPLPPAVLGWKDLVGRVAAKEGFPAHWIAGVMALESGGNPNAGSPAGAQGLLQLMPATARALAGRTLGPGEILDPELNVTLGARLLAKLSKRYNGNLVQVFFAYNAGSALCGAGVSHGYGNPADKGNPCSPNVWNVVADCYSSSQATVDYASIVIGYGNEALSQGFVAGGGASGGPGLGPLVLQSTIAFLGALLVAREVMRR
jgi:hypothetical protein